MQMAEMIGTAFQVKGAVCTALAVESRRVLGRNRIRARLERGVAWGKGLATNPAWLNVEE